MGYKKGIVVTPTSKLGPLRSLGSHYDGLYGIGKATVLSMGLGFQRSLHGLQHLTLNPKRSTLNPIGAFGMLRVCSSAWTKILFFGAASCCSLYYTTTLPQLALALYGGG